MEDSVIVNEFLNYLQYEKRFSDHTAKCYGVDLAQFSEFLTSRSEAGSGGGDAAGSDSMTGSRSGGAAVATQTRVDINGLLVAADVNTIRSYMAVLNEKQYSKATIARKLATLRSFYKFLLKRNRISSNPVVGIRTPKQEKKLPRFLEYEEIKQLLNTPPMDTWLGTGTGRLWKHCIAQVCG